jgi:hypothetical protein
VVVIICVTNGFNATTARHFPKAVHILLIVMNIRNRSSLTVALMSTLAIGHEPIFSSHLLMFGWLIDRQQPTKSSAVPIETVLSWDALGDGAPGEGCPGALTNRNSIPPSGDRSAWLPNSLTTLLNRR